MVIQAKSLVNSFNITIRVPPEILDMACSYLITEEDVLSASQVCRHWRWVLISSPSLWTQFSCHYPTPTIISLERCKSMPIQLKFGRHSSIAAVEEVILHGNEITSLIVDNICQTPVLHRLFRFSRPSLEQLLVYNIRTGRWRDEEQTVHEIRQDWPALRELFVCQCHIRINQLIAPDLVHLVLECTGDARIVTMQSIFGMLRGCPLLETLLVINKSKVHNVPTRDPSPVSLPHLRSIELGVYEVRSGLMTHLRFPKNVAVGIRGLFTTDLCVGIPPAVTDTIQHVLEKIEIRHITLALPSGLRPGVPSILLARFEGLQGSLEITTSRAGPFAVLHGILFGPGGILFFHPPSICNVQELHIVACSFDGGQGLHHIGAAMPNLVSVSFSHCNGSHVLRQLAPTDSSLPPFPHLERVMVLGLELGLREMAKKRRDCGVPLKTLVIGRGFERFRRYRPEDYAGLGEFVDDLRIRCPTETLEWGIGNEILTLWRTNEVPGSVSPGGNLMALG